MIKVACLGAGYFSQFHIDGWQRIKDAQIVGISNRDRTKAEATGLPVFDSTAQMLEATDADILDIIVSPEGHADAIRTAVKFKLKAIICQKPFCTSGDEARQMIALAKTADIPLIVHENFRFQQWYRAIKTSIENGDIGTPLQATMRMRPGDGQGRDAYLARQPFFQKMPRFLIHETGVHWVDTFRFLFGDPHALYADLRQVNPVIAGEDAGYVLFDHPHNMRVMFDANRCLDHAAENTRCTMGEGLFEGNDGSLNLQGDGSVHLRKFGMTGSTQILATDTTGIFGGDCTHLLQAHVIDALLHGGTFENLAEDYLTVMKIEDAIYTSSDTQKKIALAL
jgi:predicted dehydrogenase